MSKAPSGRTAAGAKRKPTSRRRTKPEPIVEPRCVVCEGRPVADVTFETVKGYLRRYQRDETSGPFCRTCGEAVYRDATSRTLGWFGLGTKVFVLGIRAIVRNRRALKVIHGLAEPDSGEEARRLNPGRRVIARPGGLVGVAMTAVIAFAMIAIAFVVVDGPAGLYDGECVNLVESQQSVEVVECSAANDGKVISIVEAGTSCPAATDIIVTLEDDPGRELCVDAG